MVADLIIYAYDNGYELSFGDAYAKTGHKTNSNHYVRLAIDLNAFINGMYMDTGPKMEEVHNKLHDYWDSLGGAERIKDDLNHYSLDFMGRR